MKRRSFLKVSGLGAGALLIDGCEMPNSSARKKYTIEVISDASAGHIMREQHAFEKIDAGELDVAIIGGGIAGLTALRELKGVNAQLFELSDQFGGTSSAHYYKDLRFAQGAHYELAYPKFFGNKVPELLEQLNVMEYNGYNDFWEFKEKQFLIPPNLESRCWIDGGFKSDPVDGAEDKSDFIDLTKEYYGKLPMPTTSISEDIFQLDNIRFDHFLKKQKNFSEKLLTGIDYQMYDDYGGGIDQVSALAGLHYYACRPYETQDIELFSPPEGNYYFAQRLIADVEVNQMHSNHLVSQVVEDGDHWKVSVVDIVNKQIKEYKAKSVVMTGKKHILPYIFPTLKFEYKANYAPWVSVNVVVPKEFTIAPAVWQNDVVGLDDSFLGFVNSRSQLAESKYLQTYTCYYCLDSNQRAEVLSWEKNADAIAERTISILKKVLNDASLDDKIIHVSMKLMGHAMAIPEVGFLGQDLNLQAPDSLAFGGVDNGNLPLFFEAMNSGITAAERVKKFLEI